ncbi:unnamed protein product, partial [Didymodactylos carnosus]
FTWVAAMHTASQLTAGDYICTIIDSNGDNKLDVQVAMMAHRPSLHLRIVRESSEQQKEGPKTAFDLRKRKYETSACNVADNLSAGNYNWIVTDKNGCTANTGIIFTQPAILNQSTDQIADVGANVSFTTVVDKPSEMNYQWQISNDHSFTMVTTVRVALVLATVVIMVVVVVWPRQVGTLEAPTKNVMQYCGNWTLALKEQNC